MALGFRTDGGASVAVYDRARLVVDMWGEFGAGWESLDTRGAERKAADVRRPSGRRKGAYRPGSSVQVLGAGPHLKKARVSSAPVGDERPVVLGTLVVFRSGEVR